MFYHRHFLDFEVDKFIDSNPQISVYTQQRNGRDPRLVANYCKFHTAC